MLNALKNNADKTYTENGALTYTGTGSDCLDFFASAGALRSADEEDIIKRFARAYAENADLALKALFFARDIRGGLGERRLFRVLERFLADCEPESVRKNIPYVAEYGRFDDLLCLFGTQCENEMLSYIKGVFAEDMKKLQSGQPVSLLGKWLPSVNASNGRTVRTAKKTAAALGMNCAQYRRALSSLRAAIKIIENNLREKNYTFEYEKQPSKALLKYKKAFIRNDGERYRDFIESASANPSIMHAGTLFPYEIVTHILRAPSLPEEERKAADTAWKALDNFAGNENALAVIDGSGSMYGGRPVPAAVALSLGIYFAERNTGVFHNHFITFSENPRLIEIKGRDIFAKVKFCVGYNECANTDLAKVFDLILKSAVENKLSQKDMPARLYIISDMEFDSCCKNADMTNFACAKAKFESCGFSLPQVVFWNVQSRNIQQPVKMNEQGAALVSGCTPRLFAMLKEGVLDPYAFMLSALSSERYAAIKA
ncbi:DUF2828 family protein [bacterium]|nr:DUF2828 family protein [bacterium]